MSVTLNEIYDVLVQMLAELRANHPPDPTHVPSPIYGPGSDDYGRRPPPLTALSHSPLTMDGFPMEAIPLPPARGVGVFSVGGPNGELPSYIATPGATNPAVTDDPATLKATIGTSGWTATVRPPVSYTNALKVQVMAEYALTGNPSDFELDHLIPLCCGGHPTSQLNLWAQRRAGINGAPLKDITEVAAQHAILNGLMSLQEVQQGFRSDWTQLHDHLFKSPQVVKLMMMGMAPPEPEP